MSVIGWMTRRPCARHQRSSWPLRVDNACYAYTSRSTRFRRRRDFERLAFHGTAVNAQFVRKAPWKSIIRCGQ